MVGSVRYAAVRPERTSALTNTGRSEGPNHPNLTGGYRPEACSRLLRAILKKFVVFMLIEPCSLSCDVRLEFIDDRNPPWVFAH